MANRIKEMLEAGKVVVGPFIISSAPVMVELAGAAGFDFVIIDMEHTSTDFGTVEQMVLAARASGIVPGVRVPENRPTHILRALEIGAQIVDVPLINTRVEAESVVRAGKYFPLGERGCAPITRGAYYGTLGDIGKTLKKANEETMLMVQIETQEGVENVAEICSVDEIDIVFIGPADLSQSMGMPGGYDEAAFDDAIRKVIKVTRAYNKIAGLFVVGGTEAARKWIDEGAQLLTPFADSYQIYLQWKTVMDEYSQYLSGTTPTSNVSKKNPNYDWFDVI